MAVLSTGYSFGAAEQVTNAKLAAMVNSATISGIVNADIDAGAAIASTKFGNIDGAKLTGLANIAAGAGLIPAANIPAMSTDKLTSGTLPVARGGTGATATANTANGVVVPTGAVNAANGAVILDASGKLPAVDGSQLTNLPASSVGFGSWTNVSSFFTGDDNTKQATTDGFVSAKLGSAGSTMTAYFYTDSNSTPGTLMYSVTLNNGLVDYMVHPVRKNDYYRIAHSGNSITKIVYWLPLGS